MLVQTVGNVLFDRIADEKCMCVSRSVLPFQIYFDGRILIPMWYLKLHNCVCTYLYIYIYICMLYIYIEREREKNNNMNIYIYIFIRIRLPCLVCPVTAVVLSVRPSRRPSRRRRRPSSVRPSRLVRPVVAVVFLCPSAPVRPVVVLLCRLSRLVRPVVVVVFLCPSILPPFSVRRSRRPSK